MEDFREEARNSRERFLHMSLEEMRVEPFIFADYAYVLKTREKIQERLTLLYAARKIETRHSMETGEPVSVAPFVSLISLLDAPYFTKESAIKAIFGTINIFFSSIHDPKYDEMFSAYREYYQKFEQGATLSELEAFEFPIDKYMQRVSFKNRELPQLYRGTYEKEEQKTKQRLLFQCRV